MGDVRHRQKNQRHQDAEQRQRPRGRRAAAQVTPQAAGHEGEGNAGRRPQESDEVGRQAAEGDPQGHLLAVTLEDQLPRLAARRPRPASERQSVGAVDAAA